MLIPEQNNFFWWSQVNQFNQTTITRAFTTQEPGIKMLMRDDLPAAMQQSLPDGDCCLWMKNWITSGLDKSHSSLLRAPTYSIRRQKMTIKQIYCQWEMFLLHSTAPTMLVYIHITRSRDQSCLVRGGKPQSTHTNSWEFKKKKKKKKPNKISLSPRGTYFLFECFPHKKHTNMQQGHHNKDRLIKKPFYSLNSVSQ